jgi:hypothetical protein
MKRVIMVLMMMVSVCSVWGQSNNYAGPTLEKIIVEACYKRVDPNITYDAGYYKIDYPMGDVPADRGCCSDAVIRVLRDIGIDLQEMVHKDIMLGTRPLLACPDSVWANPYKNIKPDTNIDHRRVWTLLKFFRIQNRQYASPLFRTCKINKPLRPGTIVIWELWPGQGHIGIVVDGEKVFHQIGYGQEISEDLHSYKIVAAFAIFGPVYNDLIKEIYE